MIIRYKNYKAIIGTTNHDSVHVRYYRKGWFFWREFMNEILSIEGVLDRIVDDLTNYSYAETKQKKEFLDKLLKEMEE